MAGDNYSKVAAGQPVSVSAEFMNDVRQMVSEWKALQLGTGMTEGPFDTGAHTGIVEIRNDADATVQIGGVLGISGLAITASDNPDFADGESTAVIYTGTVPTTAAHAGKFVVAAEPINPGEIGRAYMWGAHVAKVNVTEEGHGWAEVKNNDMGSLQSDSTGSAQILWIESGTGVKNAIVRMFNMGSGGDMWHLAYHYYDCGVPGYVLSGADVRVIYDGGPAQYTAPEGVKKHKADYVHVEIDAPVYVGAPTYSLTKYYKVWTLSVGTVTYTGSIEEPVIGTASTVNPVGSLVFLSPGVGGIGEEDGSVTFDVTTPAGFDSESGNLGGASNTKRQIVKAKLTTPSAMRLTVQSAGANVVTGCKTLNFKAFLKASVGADATTADAELTPASDKGMILQATAAGVMAYVLPMLYE